MDLRDILEFMGYFLTAVAAGALGFVLGTRRSGRGPITVRNYSADLRVREDNTASLRVLYDFEASEKGISTWLLESATPHVSQGSSALLGSQAAVLEPTRDERLRLIFPQNLRPHERYQLALELELANAFEQEHLWATRVDHPTDNALFKINFEDSRRRIVYAALHAGGVPKGTLNSTATESVYHLSLHGIAAGSLVEIRWREAS